ncbi:MAG: hemerythrin [Methylomonas sp.]|jgi:hemerythrin|uniref:bacteriohemerythrin n=1 Tax=Methylomonas sp. TaxID=418 RepID=UPI0025F3BFF0|nr:hemerythrin domain-containing protein [Methylomonas sp.]MCK9606135.1 hemerythrin [Methylomonas sp.]
MAIDIRWDKRFEVGHLRIDHEHQVFLDLIRSVSLASEAEEPKAWCMRLLNEVRKYADFHFFSEENIMLRNGYPDYPEHQQKHTELLTLLDDRIHAYAIDRINLEAVVVFMFDWFAMHTTKLDKKFGKYLDGHNE